MHGKTQLQFSLNQTYFYSNGDFFPLKARPMLQQSSGKCGIPKGLCAFWCVSFQSLLLNSDRESSCLENQSYKLATIIIRMLPLPPPLQHSNDCQGICTDNSASFCPTFVSFRICIFKSYCRQGRLVTISHNC